MNENIPSQYRDSEGHWVGVTTRARVVYASKDRVEQDSITYDELADPKWKGRICTRSGQHVYNVALFAAVVAHKGEEAAEKWLEGLRDNLARKPAGNDRAQVQGIYSGECDISIGNTYYMGAMLQNEKEPEQKEWANSAKILFPTFEDGTTHVNISGMVLAKHAPNKAEAMKLIEFLSSDQAQKIYAEANNEYPVEPGIEPSELVASWGTFKPTRCRSRRSPRTARPPASWLTRSATTTVPRADPDPIPASSWRPVPDRRLCRFSGGPHEPHETSMTGRSETPGGLETGHTEQP